MRHTKLWNKDYTILLQGNTVSAIGDLMYSVAISYWVYEKTGSTGLMGVMSAISMFVTMFLSPFSGSIIDKCNRKWVIFGVDILQGVIMLGIGALAFANALSVPIVLIAAFLASFGNIFYSPAVSTLMLDIIPHDKMVQGQSIHSGAITAVNLVGSAFSGAMVAFLGVPLIVVINVISNLYSGFSELFVHVPKTVQQGTAVTVKSVLADFVNAIKNIFSDRFLRIFVPCALILNLLGSGPMTLILPLCMEKGFSVDMYGYLMSVVTAGALLCVLLLGIFKLKPIGRFWIMSLGFCGEVLMLIIAYLSQRFLTMCVFGFLGVMLNYAGNTIFNASLMLALPEENRGAILGFIQSASVGGSALSALLYGLLGDIFPLYLTFVIGTAVSLIPMIYLCFNGKTKEFMINH